MPKSKIRTVLLVLGVASLTVSTGKAFGDDLTDEAFRWRLGRASDNVIDCRPNQGVYAALRCWWYN